MTPVIRRVVAALAIAVFLVVAIVAYQAERQRCTTNTTAPFFAHTARGLATALDGTDVSETERVVLADQLGVDADRLDTVAARCRWPW